MSLPLPGSCCNQMCYFYRRLLLALVPYSVTLPLFALMELAWMLLDDPVRGHRRAQRVNPSRQIRLSPGCGTEADRPAPPAAEARGSDREHGRAPCRHGS